jgi:hypothetical protein
MVIDSASFTNLQGVHVKVKKSGKIAVTDANGLFWIVAKESDTLVFSLVGYVTAEAPAYVGDDIMLVQLHEKIIQLKEVTVEGQPLGNRPEYTESPTLSSVKPLKAAGFSPTGGVGVNFDYFSKLEKEKRKLVKVLEEQRRSRVYVEIVTDPRLRMEMMELFSIDEATYYHLLAQFNENHSEVMHSSNEAVIANAITTFFRNALKGK